MQTNEIRNAIIHYSRSANGMITELERIPTGGAGSGIFKPTSGQNSAPNSFDGADPRQVACVELKEWWPMIRRARLALFSLLVFGLSGQALSVQAAEVAFRLGPIELLGDGPSYAEMGVGAFDVFAIQGKRTTSAAAEAQLRWGRKAWFIGPAIGLMGNTDGGVFGYAGIYTDLVYGHVVFTPVLGLGGYAQGDSKELGGVFEFRSELGVAYQFHDGSRLGMRIAHLSNAGIYNQNPGEEELHVTYALPFP